MIIITVLAAVLLASLTAGALALLRASIAREDSASSLLGEPRTRATAWTRRVVGVYVRTPWHVREPDAVADGTEEGHGHRPPTSAGPR